MANGYDEAALTKYGFLLGLGLFVVGVLGETALPAVAGPLPGWENALFTDMELFGILTGLFSVFVLGIFLPLTR